MPAPASSAFRSCAAGCALLGGAPRRRSSSSWPWSGSLPAGPRSRPALPAVVRGPFRVRRRSRRQRLPRRPCPSRRSRRRRSRRSRPSRKPCRLPRSPARDPASFDSPRRTDHRLDTRSPGASLDHHGEAAARPPAGSRRDAHAREVAGFGYEPGRGGERRAGRGACASGAERAIRRSAGSRAIVTPAAWTATGWRGPPRSCRRTWSPARRRASTPRPGASTCSLELRFADETDRRDRQRSSARGACASKAGALRTSTTTAWPSRAAGAPRPTATARPALGPAGRGGDRRLLEVFLALLQGIPYDRLLLAEGHRLRPTAGRRGREGGGGRRRQHHLERDALVAGPDVLHEQRVRPGRRIVGPDLLRLGTRAVREGEDRALLGDELVEVAVAASDQHVEIVGREGPVHGSLQRSRSGGREVHQPDEPGLQGKAVPLRHHRRGSRRRHRCRRGGRGSAAAPAPAARPERQGDRGTQDARESTNPIGHGPSSTQDGPLTG